MIPASSLVSLHRDLVLRSRWPAMTRVRRRHVARRSMAVRAAALLFTMVVASSATLAYVRLADLTGTDALRARAETAEESLRASETQAAAQAAAQTAQAAAQASTVSRLEGRVAGLLERLETARASKVRTVVETETVVEKVIRWIPNGEGISVELTGYEGQIGIRDVQITQAYGFSDLIGIAVNKSGRTISYAQLGCTFLAEDGTVLANSMVNKLNWAPGQTWGFDCSAQVDAAGGIMRVDEMT